MSIEFQAWPKTPRLNRDITITEKIDGTNAAVIIEVGDPSDYQDGWCASVSDDLFYKVGAQSRNRIITPGGSTDNAGFAGWVAENAERLVAELGPGRHYGEWWGKGIQRGYGMEHRVFSLFNTHRFRHLSTHEGDLRVVPTLYHGPFDSEWVDNCIDALLYGGSIAAPGFTGKAEGVIVYHSAANQVFKVLCEHDDIPKTIAEQNGAAA